MARYRTVKPELYSDEKLCEVSRDCRLLFIGLLNFSDDMGRMAYAPKRIKMEIFLGDEDVTPKQVSVWIRQFEQAHVLKLYEVDEHFYLWIPAFLRHQKIDKSHTFPQSSAPSGSRPGLQVLAMQSETNGAGVFSETSIRRTLDESLKHFSNSTSSHRTVPNGGNNRGESSKSGVRVRQNQNQTHTDSQQQNSDQQPSDIS